MLFSNRYYYPDEQIVGFSMVFQLLSGIGGIWSLPRWWPLEKQWRRWLSSCIHSCLSPSCTQMWSLSKVNRRSKALLHSVPSLSELGLSDSSLALHLRSHSHNQNNTNKQKGEQSALQSNKAKLYCISSHLSMLKECIRPEIGTVG